MGWGLEQTAHSRPPPTLCCRSSPLSVTQLHFLSSIITFHVTSRQIHFWFLCAPLLVPVSIFSPLVHTHSRCNQLLLSSQVLHHCCPPAEEDERWRLPLAPPVGPLQSIHPTQLPPPWDVYLIHSLVLQCCHDNRRRQTASVCAASLINKGSLLWQQEPEYKPQKKTFLTSWGE